MEIHLRRHNQASAEARPFTPNPLFSLPYYCAQQASSSYYNWPCRIKVQLTDDIHPHFSSAHPLHKLVPISQMP